MKKINVLVTGATGFLGKSLVKMLIDNNYQVYALARKQSNVSLLNELNVKIFYGDIREQDSIEPAFHGVDYVVHAAADTIGNKEGGEFNTIQGTQNIVDLCKKNKIKKLVYISSCSVYGVADYKEGEIVSEEATVERFPEKRGFYSYAKMKAEKIVTDLMKSGEVATVCLRPGTYFGPGGDIYTPIMGFSIRKKIFFIIGNGKFILPLVYIENVAAAILSVLGKDNSAGNIYNIVDESAVSKRQYVQMLLKKLYPRACFLYIPYTIIYGITFIQEITFKLFNIKPILTTYRLGSSQRNVKYDSSKIRKELNWLPLYTIQEALEIVVAHEYEKIEDK